MKVSDARDGVRRRACEDRLEDFANPIPRVGLIEPIGCGWESFLAVAEGSVDSPT